MKEKLKYTKIICSVCFFCIGVIFAMQLFKVSKKAESDYDTNRKIISELNQELNKEPESVKEITDMQESASDKMSTATFAGNKVAELQNKYQDINTYSASDAITANAEEIDKYLAESDKEDRVPWYMVETAGKYTWEFDTTYSFTATTVPTLWTCYDSNGQLLAYATATYNAESQLFSDVEYHLTMVGASHVESTDTITGNNSAGGSEYGAPEPERADGRTMDSIRLQDSEFNKSDVETSEIE